MATGALVVTEHEKVDTKTGDRVGAKVGAAMLGASPVLNYWSLVLALVALLTLALSEPDRATTVALGVSLALALAQVGLAARCAFDADLFARLADEDCGLEQLDVLLRDLGLRAGPRVDRDIVDRLRGALRLFKMQGWICLLQTVAVVLALVLEGGA